MRIDWERWIGVRGAAALGAGVLVIAGLYFFKYSLDNGLISPSLRVVLGTLTGLGCLAGSERTRRRETPVLANWLAGAGIAILYLAFWSAHAMYELVPMAVAFGSWPSSPSLAGCLDPARVAGDCAARARGRFLHAARASSGSDQPLGLFGYLLLLDVALLYLAHKRSWPVLGALSLGGTFLYQVGWVGERMGPDRPRPRHGRDPRLRGRVRRRDAARRGARQRQRALARHPRGLDAAALRLWPLFGLRSDLGEHLYLLGAMLVLLAVGAAWIARARRIPWLRARGGHRRGHRARGLARAPRHGGDPWEVSGIFVLFGVVFHGFLELERLRPRDAENAGPSRAAAVASLGPLLLLILAAAAPSSSSPWPWLAGWLVLAALTLRHAGFAGARRFTWSRRWSLGLGFPIVYAAHAHDLGAGSWPRADRFFAVMVAGAFGFQVIALLRSAADTRRWATLAAAVSTLLAFATAIHVVTRADIGPNLFPVIALLTVLAGGASWIARERRGLAPPGGLARRPRGDRHLAALPRRRALAVETAALTSLYAGVFHVFLELQRKSPRPDADRASSSGAATASVGGLRRPRARL